MSRALQIEQKPEPASVSTQSHLLQRKCACGGASGAGQECSSCRDARSTMPNIVNETLNSAGQSLDHATRADMEAHFGHDFSRVKVHSDARAAASADSISARAYTYGRDVVFGAGQYAPETITGKQLLAHELAHVIQQGDKDHSPSEIRGSTSPTDAVEHEAHQAAAAVTSSTKPSVQPHAKAAGMLMGDWQFANPFPGGSAGHPPAGLTGCHVYLGGRRIDDFWAGTIANFRHLYIDTYEGPSNFALIEAGPVGGITGTSGAWVKNSDWDARGAQWDITPEQNCPGFISCLKTQTAAYHAAAHPYHYRYGPNSNSFAQWVLSRCGLNISFLISGWPYLGVDYWTTHTAPARTPTPTPAPATP